MADDGTFEAGPRDGGYGGFEPYPRGALASGGDAIRDTARATVPIDVDEMILRACRSIEAMSVDGAPDGCDRPELELTLEQMIVPEQAEPLGEPAMVEPETPIADDAADRTADIQSDMVDETDATGRSEGLDYVPMPVLDETGLPVRPTTPVTDRRDLYRLVMAHRRRDPRTSSAIMDAAGAGRMYANPMLNHGRPGNDISLIAVARLYGIEPGFAAGRGVDLSSYVGMARDDVRGPEVLSASDAGRLGAMAHRSPVVRDMPESRDEAISATVDETGASVTARPSSKDEDGAHSTLIARLVETARTLGDRLIESASRERRAGERVMEAELLANKAKAAAIASEMRAAEAEAGLAEARTILGQVRDMLMEGRNGTP